MLEDRVPADDPLWVIDAIAALILRELSARLDAICAANGRSISLKVLLYAVLRILYPVCRERVPRSWNRSAATAHLSVCRLSPDAEISVSATFAKSRG